MRKTLLASAAAIAGTLSIPAAALAEEAAPASPLSFNVGIVSDYLFRGVSQTHGKPAVQAGVDYAHPGGFYVGAWASNITWVKDWLGKGSAEVDVYGGFKQTIGDWGYDVGYIAYNYPGHGSANQPVTADPNTQEVYISGSWKWLSAKYSYVTSSHFIGWYGAQSTATLDQKTRGSDYLELNANHDLGDGWTLIGHAGHQRVKNLSIANYTDWKIGATKDIGFGVVGLAWSDTNAKGSAMGDPYYWGTDKNTGDFRNVAKGKFVASYLKTF